LEFCTERFTGVERSSLLDEHLGEDGATFVPRAFMEML